jgi:hypothetical protein
VHFGVGKFGVAEVQSSTYKKDWGPETGSVERGTLPRTPKVTDCRILKTETGKGRTGKSRRGMGRRFSPSPFLRSFFPIEPGPVLRLVADRH